ncbi:MAG: right-handed parallel beta-helix repeat-containing protein [Candidatus Bathyarchaeota archaeon]|nr:right-handed parallel beta-helix repeat-containing protein [Candidatus Bathyarchaeum sp.]
MATIGVQFVKLAEANFIPAPDHASSIFIRSDGSVDPSTVPIQRVGNVYTFTGDVSGGIAVERSNVIVDGNGYQLLGGGGGTGLYVKMENNVTVQNVRIHGFSYAFYWLNTNCSVIQGNQIVESGGINIQGSCYNNILQNTITRGGVSLSRGSDSIIMDNDVGGISILSASNIIIKNNKVSNETRKDVEMLYVADVGAINLEQSDNCEVFGNTIERKMIGINIRQCTNLKFSNNTLVDNQVGFKLLGTQLERNMHSIDTTNTVNGKPVYFLVNQSDIQVPTDAGWIAAINCNNITVENWASTPNWDAILFVKTSDSRISNSTLTENFNAIRFDLVSNCTIFGNLISDNGYAAFYFEDTLNCTITENNVVDNFCYFNIWHNSANNTFFHNNFIGNWTGSPGDRDIQNFWDNGFEGNYWEAYNATDTNGDNIGDTQYIIDSYSNSTDRYPLMTPVSISNELPEFSSWTFTLIALSVLIFALNVYKRKLHNKIRSKKRAICKHELKQEINEE